MVSDLSVHTTEELLELRARARREIRWLENGKPRTATQDKELRFLREYLRSLMRECGKRFIHERLF